MLYVIFVYGFGYGLRPKAEVFQAEHSAMAESENWAYGPTLLLLIKNHS